MTINAEDRAFPKTVYEEYTFEFDFAPSMPPGSATIATCATTATEDDGTAAPSVVLTTTVVPTSTKINVKVTGGEDGKNYKLFHRAVLTTTAEKIEGMTLMQVRNF